MVNSKRPKKIRNKTLFYDLFIGEYVEIISKCNIKVTEEGPNGIIVQETPMVFSGYVIDIDDAFLYLGPEAMTVSQAVKREEFVSISVMEKETKTEQANKEDKNLN